MNKLEATTEIVITMITEGKLGADRNFDNSDDKFDFVIDKIKRSITEIYETIDKLDSN